MNKIVYTIVIWFSFFSTNTQSQEKAEFFNFEEELTGNHDYEARDYITLKNGFSYKAGHNTTFNASIDKFMTFAPTANTYKTSDGTLTSDKTMGGGVVGAIPGSFNVSESGAATYIIPIEGVMGMDGLQPNISLSYNSQSGHGIAGLGWSIGGISEITKIPKNKYFDDEVTGIEWDGPMALDGVRMIATTSNEYYLENDVTRKIEKHTDTNGTIYFIISTKEGLEITYGKTENAKSYLKYDNGKPDRGNVS